MKHRLADILAPILVISATFILSGCSMLMIGMTGREAPRVVQRASPRQTVISKLGAPLESELHPPIPMTNVPIFANTSISRQTIGYDVFLVKGLRNKSDDDLEICWNHTLPDCFCLFLPEPFLMVRSYKYIKAENAKIRELTVWYDDQTNCLHYYVTLPLFSGGRLREGVYYPASHKFSINTVSAFDNWDSIGDGTNSVSFYSRLDRYILEFSPLDADEIRKANQAERRDYLEHTLETLYLPRTTNTVQGAVTVLTQDWLPDIQGGALLAELVLPDRSSYVSYGSGGGEWRQYVRGRCVLLFVRNRDLWVVSITGFCFSASQVGNTQTHNRIRAEQKKSIFRFLNAVHFQGTDE